MKRLRWIVLLIVTLLLLSQFFFVKGATAEKFAAMRGDQLVLVEPNVKESVIALPAHRSVANLQWSPNGQWLGLVLVDENYALRLWLVDVTGAQPQLRDLSAQTGILESGFPIAFTPEGNVLYASPVSDQVSANGEYWVNLNTIPPFGDAQPTTLGKISFGVGCGGGSPLPADWQYWQETGFGGNYLTLQWTSFGILHSLSCNGDGAALLDPQTGMDRILAPLSDSQSQPEVHLSRLKVSPDGTLIAAIKTSYQGANVQTGVALIDLATGALTDVSTAQMPEQLGWLGSDTLYYSTRVPRSDLIAALAPEQKQAFDSAIGGNGMSVGSWDLFIRQIKLVNRASAADQVVYSADGYQIGRFEAASDGALWFSQIPNLNSWLAEIVSGELDLTQATQADQLETVPVSIFMLQSDGTSPVSLIAEGLNQFVIQPTP